MGGGKGHTLAKDRWGSGGEKEHEAEEYRKFKKKDA